MSLQANIHPSAKIGKGTVVEPFATISGDVEIGENCWVGPGTVIADGSRIGNNVKIFPGAIIGVDSQDLKYKGEYTTTHIGSGTTIREYVTVHRGTADKLKTVVGENCLLMAYVHIAHDCEVGNNVIIANNTQLAGHIVVEDWVVIEGMAAIQQFVKIGAHAFIAGGCFVRKNVPPYTKAAREPLSYVGVNSIGLRRRGFKDEQIACIEDTYRVLYVQNNNISQALKVADLELPSSPEKDQILDFIRNSKKGIMRGIS